MTQPEQLPLWDKVAHNLQEWYSDAVGWTGEKARIGVKKMDIVGIQHNIKRAMTHLGGRVYDLMQRGVNVENDEQVKLIHGNLSKLEEELASREREIEDLRASRRGADESEAVAVPDDPDPDPDPGPASGEGETRTPEGGA
jgi:hypothetical protein